MPTPLLIATTNAAKVREIRELLAGADVVLRTLADFPPVAAPEETGRTFAENARLKATYYARVLGQLTVAEDSGLEIDALGGAPGVESARLGGEHASYEEKFALIYARLRAKTMSDQGPTPVGPMSDRGPTDVGHLSDLGRTDVGHLSDRGRTSVRQGSDLGQTARFVCALAVARGDDVLFEARGTIEGVIAAEPLGTGGFGYDPIFFYPPFGRTLAEAADRKSEVSHRAAAFRQLRQFLPALTDLRHGNGG